MDTTLNRFYPLALLFYFLSIVFVCYFSIQKQFETIAIPCFLAFTAFFILQKFVTKKNKFKEVLILILLLKIAILFSFPHLSDDIYRFWWDGYLSCHGISPYEFTPTEIISKFHHLIIYPSLLKNYPLLNSAGYHTAYPLICQWIFRIAAFLSGENIMVFNFILKFIFLFADSLTLFFLLKFLKEMQVNKNNAILFYGNPLCIIELNANLHFEIFLILFLVISLYLNNQKKFLYSGLHLGLSIVSKLVSFLWIPLFIKWPIWKKSQLLFYLGIFIPIGFFLLIILPSISLYQNSLGLYFQKFEFNSFIYRPAIEYFDNHKWYEEEAKISLVLMLVFILIYAIIVIKAWIKENNAFPFKSAWLILFLYLILGTTIHPWYLTPLILLSVFTFQKTGMVWSSLIILSYARYDPLFKPYDSSLVLLEYIIVLACFLWELRKENTGSTYKIGE